MWQVVCQNSNPDGLTPKSVFLRSLYSTFSTTMHNIFVLELIVHHYNFLFLFIYFWLPLVFTAAHGLFLSCSEQGLFSSFGAQAFHCGGFSCCGAQAVGSQASGVVGMWTPEPSWGAWTWLPHGRWNLPGPRNNWVCCLHWQADSLVTGLPGKSNCNLLFIYFVLLL